MPDSREPYGRIVRETWVAWAKEQPDPKPSWLLEWDDLPDDDPQREVDVRIGSAVAVQAVHGAGLENTRRDAQLFALSAHLPAILDVLRLAAADSEYGARARRFDAALTALGGSEEAGNA